MWVIVRRQQDGAFDLVPTMWLINDSKCYFPDGTKPTVLKMAKKCVVHEDDWPVLEITVVKKFIDDFERGMRNLVRFERDLPNLTNSEAEGRGRGCRIKRKFLQSSSESDSDDKKKDHGSVPVEKSSNYPSSSTPLRAHSGKNSDYPAPPFLARPHSDNLAETPNPQGVNNTLVALRSDRCRIKQSRHHCPFKSSQATVEALAHSLCALSRDMNILTSSIRSLGETMNSWKESNTTGRAMLPDVGIVSFMEVLSNFPLLDLPTFNDYDEKLKEDKKQSDEMVHALFSVCEKTNPSRCVTSVLNKLLSNDLALKFSLKGQARKDQYEEKHAFIRTKLHEITICVVQRVFKEVTADKINVTIGTWLAQAAARNQRKKKNEIEKPAPSG